MDQAQEEFDETPVPVSADRGFGVHLVEAGCNKLRPPSTCAVQQLKRRGHLVDESFALGVGAPEVEEILWRYDKASGDSGAGYDRDGRHL